MRNFLKLNIHIKPIKFKYLIIFFMILVWLPMLMVSQTKINTQTGGQSQAMANANVAITDVWAVNYNQAALVGIEQIQTGIGYSNHYFLKELGLSSGVFAMPLSVGVIAASYDYFGYSTYHESSVGLAFARALGEKISAGIKVNYHNTFINDSYYGKTSSVTVEGGILARLSDELKVGAHIFNPLRAKLADYNDERIPTILKAGLSYNFSDKAILCIEAEKNSDYKAIYKAGIHYIPVENFYLRGGLSNEPTNYTFGLGFLYHNFRFDLAYGHHRILGSSPHFSLTYKF